jgi:hypothetical protein
MTLLFISPKTDPLAVRRIEGLESLELGPNHIQHKGRAQSGNVWGIVLTGDIFNIMDLARDHKLPIPNSPAADLDTLRELLKKYEPLSLFRNLHGAFQLCLYNFITFETWVALDPLGGHYGYWCVNSSGLRYSTTLDQLGNPYSTINAAWVESYFRGKINNRESTALSGVRRLLGGDALHILNGQVEVKQYYCFEKEFKQELEFEPRITEPDEAFHAIEAVLRSSAVYCAARYDSVGVLLSQGVDSITQASLLVSAGAKVCSFSKMYSDSPHLSMNMELHRKNLLALGIENHVSNIDLSGELCTIRPEDYNQPDSNSWSSVLVEYRTVVSAAVANGAKAILVGYDADEIFLHRYRFLSFFHASRLGIPESAFQGGGIPPSLRSALPENDYYSRNEQEISAYHLRSFFHRSGGDFSRYIFDEYKFLQGVCFEREYAILADRPVFNIYKDIRILRIIWRLDSKLLSDGMIDPWIQRRILRRTKMEVDFLPKRFNNFTSLKRIRIPETQFSLLPRALNTVKKIGISSLAHYEKKVAEAVELGSLEMETLRLLTFHSWATRAEE